ncbi:hypothetical protein LINPERHAP1_LOCUS16228, partial [Linum perenne]
QGKDIWGQIPEDLISKFQSLLEDRKVYTILNFKVVNAPKQFRNISNTSTTVEEVANMSAIPEYKFTFIRESEIPSNKHNRLSLFAIIITFFICTIDCYYLVLLSHIYHYIILTLTQ